MKLLKNEEFDMKIALVHISDFHIKSRDIFLREKIDSWLSALNVLGKVDDYIIIFTGDLANSGQINEYKNARHLIIKLIKGIKEKNNNKFVKTYIIPGNHDLNFPENVRDQKQIQRCYDERNIDKALEKEFCYLDNFFKFNLSTRFSDRLFKKEILTFDNYKIQLNLINTAPFSMLEPNDKELHYFPHEKIELLKKRSDVNLCITAMHHSSEWFNWEYKSHLEKTIINNSEVLLIGHDHREHTENVAIDSSMYTWISDAGTMNFSSFDSQDAFNVMVVNTECDSFDGYTFTWSSKSKLFIDKKTAKNKMLQNRSTRITPHSDFLQSLKEDSYNPCKDFTQYFVFPKLKSDSKNEFGNYEEIKSFNEFEKVLNQKKKILITGNTDSGKTSLLKYIYCNILSKKTPLLIIVDNKTRLKPNNFIKHYFEEQYGEEPELFTKFNQLNKSERILLIDGWDILHDSPLKNQVLDIIEGEFEYIIFSSHPYQKDVVESIFLGLTTEKYFSEYRIKPFYSEKRTELVRNICNQKNSFLSDQDIDNLNNLIDMLVQNNAGLFSLNPSFIIKYTNYLLEVPYQDYAKGEAIFSKIFEFELNQSIIKLSSKSDADEIFTTFEEIAGNMFCMEKDVLSIEEIKKIVDNYNTLFGVSVKTKMIIDIGLKSKILSQTDDMEIYFTNRNHLSYFVAKYLIRYAQGNPDDRQSVEFAMDKISYAMKNICFGINSDIILFISYLLNNTQTIMLIAQHANELLSSIPEVSLSQNKVVSQKS